MNTHKLSCIYYPTTTLLIDDESDFLERLSLKLGEEFPCVTYSNPQKGLDYLREEMKRSNALPTVIGIDTESEYYSYQSTRLPVHYDITWLYQKFYDFQRFSEISVLIVDYAMPEMSGEQLCIALKGSPVKTIMLTGQADKETGVRLFNEGLISKFILKQQPNLIETLKNCITEMQKSYFQDLAAPIFKGLMADEDSALNDPEFICLFNQIYQEISASSYALIDFAGSFLFLDKVGAPTWLIIKAEEEIEEITRELIDHDPYSPGLEFLRKREKIPYSPNLAGYFNPSYPSYNTHWYPAQRLQGKKDYYYAITKDLKDFPIDKNKIIACLSGEVYFHKALT
jgi:CheY-like chemotaxis protein